MPLTGTHLRPDGAVVVSSGNSQGNEGDIFIRQVSTGNERQSIFNRVLAYLRTRITPCQREKRPFY